MSCCRHEAARQPGLEYNAPPRESSPVERMYLPHWNLLSGLDDTTQQTLHETYPLSPRSRLVEDVQHNPTFTHSLQQLPITIGHCAMSAETTILYQSRRRITAHLGLTSVSAWAKRAHRGDLWQSILRRFHWALQMSAPTPKLCLSDVL